MRNFYYTIQFFHSTTTNRSSFSRNGWKLKNYLRYYLHVFIYLLVPKAIVLDFTNVNIDCSRTANNLRIVTTDGHDYTFCDNNTSNNFIYSTTTSHWAAIQRIGVISYTLDVQFISNYVPSKLFSLFYQRLNKILRIIYLLLNNIFIIKCIIT